MENKIKEFHTKRKPFYIDPETSLIKFPTQRHMNVSHAEWFTDMCYPFLHVVRGYYLKTEDDEFIMMYWNDFETPNVTVSLFSYLFEFFPTLKWIGLGCNKGKPGEIWTPKLKITHG